ncbi:hypothetical protein E2C01_013860 [Portunus trituberculatus]|uniref:Uncharacterized protein n=1 Tax=Portunus trituberculatus TaxID=210409 RepID=A0A5B7DI87_PORTR|nr:hypothetical protein [Portunus trituberculatus]
MNGGVCLHNSSLHHNCLNDGHSSGFHTGIAPEGGEGTDDHRETNQTFLTRGFFGTSLGALCHSRERQTLSQGAAKPISK